MAGTGNKMKNLDLVGRLIKDVKYNGIGYCKAEKVANEIKSRAPEIEVVWNREEQSYTLYYTLVKDRRGQ